MFEKEKLPILAILRGVEEKHLKPLAEICINCGLKYIEITMNTTNPSHLIRQMIDAYGKKLVIGAGTILNKNDLEIALEAGARFIVCPSIIEEVIKECVMLDIPIFPGVLTPSEVQKAWDMGAAMVKLFPASAFGPSYIRELKGPFNKIKIMAVGGVNEENISIYFENGADAVAIGESIFNLQWLTEGQYKRVEKKICALIKSYRKERIA
jgi:2-dehydro-3-deoxyphosphogluconate aldolase/(4S)-4-hydroxy-2-oxoglutarate aldolase